MSIDKKKIPEFPAWHEAILHAREAALKAGIITVSDWAEAKKRIKQNIAGYKIKGVRPH